MFDLIKIWLNITQNFNQKFNHFSLINFMKISITFFKKNKFTTQHHLPGKLVNFFWNKQSWSHQKLKIWVQCKPLYISTFYNWISIDKRIMWGKTVHMQNLFSFSFFFIFHVFTYLFVLKINISEERDYNFFFIQYLLKINKIFYILIFKTIDFRL